MKKIDFLIFSSKLTIALIHRLPLKVSLKKKLRKVFVDFRDIGKIKNKNLSSSVRSFSDYTLPHDCKFSVIIGAGRSLNEIKEKDWKNLRKGHLVGLNLAVLCNQKANTYFLETSPKYRFIQKAYRESITKDKKSYKRVYFVNDKMMRREINFPPKDIVNDNFYVIRPVQIPTTNKFLVWFILKFLHPLFSFHKSKILIHHGASLSMAIDYCVMMGCKTIVLAGIDLNDSRYFFYEYSDELSKKTTNFKKAQERKMELDSSTHPTINKNYYKNRVQRLDIITYLDIYSKTVAKRNKVDIFVENPKSALTSIFPVWKYNSLKN